MIPFFGGLLPDFYRIFAEFYGFVRQLFFWKGYGVGLIRGYHFLLFLVARLRNV